MKQMNKFLITVLVVAIIALTIGLCFLLFSGEKTQAITYEDGYSVVDEQFSVRQDEPAIPSLKIPEDSVLSYLLWVSWSYYMGDTSLATHVMTPAQEPRNSAFVMKLLADDMRINQRLDEFKVTSVEIEEFNSEKPGYEHYTHVATVKTEEQWTYNYQTLGTQEWNEPIRSSYAVTYTLNKAPDIGWLVDIVSVDSQEGVR
jgi:hypothetical protein